MANIMQSNVFFFISSLGFIILFLLLAILLFYAIRAFRTWDRIMNKLENNINVIGDTAKDMVEDVRDSTVFRLLIGKRKRHTKE